MTSSLLLHALCLVFVLIHSTEATLRWPIVETRAAVLIKIDGNATEDRLYFDRCRQSSISENCIFAMDNSINQEPWSNECAFTDIDARPWWEGRLEVPSYITRVFIYSMGDTVHRGFDALLDFELKAGRHVCTRYNALFSFFNKTFACDTFADFIRIEGLRGYTILTLCEVEVYGKAVKFARNVGSYGNGQVPIPAVSCLGSSEAKDGACYYAMDGNRNQDPHSSKCATTEHQEAPYFEFLLQLPALIRYVILLHRRNNGGSGNMEMFEMAVDGQVCIRYDVGITYSEQNFPCNRFGSVVRFSSKAKSSSLILCEMELYGYLMEFVERHNNKYLGCYKEKKQRRDMEHLGGIGRMSPEKCARICSRHKMPFFGLQQGKQCWCSERYGLYGMADDENCWMPCDFDEEKTCGAKLYNSIYEVIDYEDDIIAVDEERASTK